MDSVEPPDPAIEFNWSQSEEPCVAVVQALSELLEVDPMEIRPIYQVVDPDSLEQLFASPHSASAQFDGNVQFEYHDHWIHIEPDGSGYIYERDPLAAGTAT